MSEYWKSTPKYWCKHCGVYVRDTKLERSNHEATGKHQGALKRFLRDLHRGHEAEEREKERAKREIERLNGVVGTTSIASVGSASTPSTGRAAAQPVARASEAQRQKQWQQLAEMGIDVPTELRGDMAMAGEWTVTNTRVIDDAPRLDANGEIKVEALATGIRKRPMREGEDEEEDAIKGLFKRPRKWGRDTKQAPNEEEDDAELDALLSGNFDVKTQKSEETMSETVKKEEDRPSMKKEPSDEVEEDSASAEPKLDTDGAVSVKREDIAESGVDVPAVVFKKRKPKNIRHNK